MRVGTESYHSDQEAFPTENQTLCKLWEVGYTENFSASCYAVILL